VVLTVHIVKNGETTIDILVEAGLIDAIIAAMDKHGNTSAADLLYVVLYPIARQFSENANSNQLQNVIKMIAPLSGLATRCAEMILENSKAASCLGLLFHIFTPVPAKGEVPYAGCFDALGNTILKIGQNESYGESLVILAKMLVWAASHNTSANSAMKKSSTWMMAVKKLAENGSEALKNEAVKLLEGLEE
jgi:hypothetical protein